MSDFFSTAAEMQRVILQAQKAQIDAAQKMLDATKTMADATQQIAEAQAVTQNAAEANLKAWKSWAALWGWK